MARSRHSQKTLLKILVHSKTHTDGKTKNGLGKFVMIGSAFSGNIQLFDAVCEAGQCWQGNDGLWYYEASHSSDSTRITNKVIGTIDFGKISDKAFSAELMRLLEELHNGNEWDSKVKDMPNKFANMNADDNDYMLLQQAFDSVSRITLAIRKMSSELLSQGFGTVAEDAGRRGIEILKSLVKPSQTLESLMVKDRRSVLKSQVKAALTDLAGPYRDVLTMYEQILRVYAVNGGKVAKKDKIVEIKDD